MDEKELEQYFESRPAWLKKFEIDRGILILGGKPHPYTICKKEMNSNVPYFVGFFNKEHLFISEEVPESDREFYLRHEIVEFTDPEFIDQPGRCVRGVERELIEVPEEQREEYVARRIKMFEGLVIQLTEELSKLKDGDIILKLSGLLGEVTKSLNFLNSLNEKP